MRKFILCVLSLAVALCAAVPAVADESPAANNETPDTPIRDDVLYGDLDDDNSITSADSLMVLRGSVRLENFDELHSKLADVNLDGTIDSYDALEVLRHSVKLSSNRFIGKSVNDSSVVNAEKMLSLLNEERMRNGVDAVEIDFNLMNLADIRAEETSSMENLGSNRPDGSGGLTILSEHNVRYENSGELVGAAENPEKMFQLWSSSEAHHRVINNDEFKKVGIGYCYNEDSKYGSYWVLIFTD